jgi:glycosyltransferase involved in cell wall biosynthesis
MGEKGAPMKLIDAIYLNRGGSKVLLQELVDRFGEIEEVFFLLDQRVVLSRYPNRYRVVKPGELSRISFYKENARELHRVLCMGNVPPPLKLGCPVLTYFHNRLLIEPAASGSGFKTRLILTLKWFYIKMRMKNSDYLGVQTNDLAHALQSKLNDVEVKVWPFWPARVSPVNAGKNPMSFGYVSLPYPHKNHDKLIAAWTLLAAKGVFPILHLTVSSEWTDVLEGIDLSIASGAKIINHGFCNPEIIYSECKWQIYPSSCESFGLGLIESVEAGCKVITPNLPYVQEVVNPSLTWEGNSAENIAAAVINAIQAECCVSTVVINNEIEEIAEFIKGELKSKVL